jgi:integrase
MGGLQMKGVQQKGGRLYYRRKVNGVDTYIRLPAITDPGFAQAYAKAARVIPERAPALPGSFAALVTRYRGSAEFRQRRQVTRDNYSRYLDMIAIEHGTRPVAGVCREHVKLMIDRLSKTPGKANNYLTVFRLLMNYAIDIGWRTNNPATKVKPLELGSHEPWPSDVLERALAAASPMLRLAIITGLCSGVRIGDAVRIQHGWLDGEVMQLRTHKNEADVAIPMHSVWLAEIAKVPRKSVTLLYDRAGKPYDKKSLGEALRELMQRIDAKGYSFHGLRKNACCYLTELGRTDTEIGSMLGMTPAIVRLYSKRSRALMIAKGAAEQVTRGDVLAWRGTNPGKVKK